MVRTAFEDVRIAPKSDTLEEHLQQAIDALDDRIDDYISNIPSSGDTASDDEQQHTLDESDDKTYPERELSPREQPFEAHFAKDNPTRIEIEARVQVYWPLDNAYYTGEVKAISEDGKCTVHYDDNEQETLDMQNEEWRFETSDSTAAASVSLTLSSNEQHILREMLGVLGKRQFMFHQAQGFEQAPMFLAYQREESQYMQHLKIIARSRMPPDANLISSHVVYKLKLKDNDDIKLKARIAPHGNEDSDTQHPKSDCAMCPPLGIRMIIITSVIRRWRIARIKVEMAFHQTGPASRQVYVRQPRESRLSGEVWLLLVAGYGLINAGAKWQTVSDEAIRQLGMIAIPVTTQLFAKNRGGILILLVMKIVYDILLTGSPEELDWSYKKHFRPSSNSAKLSATLES